MTDGKNAHRYDDIINRPHHVSNKHPQMPLKNRAAQFSPFAALTGHDAAIKEIARLTRERAELDENTKAVIDERLRILKKYCTQQPEISVTYFQPDEQKEGGAYVTAAGKIKKIDSYGRRLFLENDMVIPVDELIAIEGGLFSGMDD